MGLNWMESVAWYQPAPLAETAASVYVLTALPLVAVSVTVAPVRPVGGCVRSACRSPKKSWAVTRACCVLTAGDDSTAATRTFRFCSCWARSQPASRARAVSRAARRMGESSRLRDYRARWRGHEREHRAAG